MKIITLLMAVALVSGCTTNHYMAGKNGRSGKLAVTALTHNSCIKKLQDTADEIGVMIKLIKVESGPVKYKCIGEVIEQ